MASTTKDPATAHSTASAPELVCWKVWGGNGQIEAPVAIPGLRGALYSQPCNSNRGGDLYYLSACGSGVLARLCLADVTGHGENVATFSGWLEEVFSKHIHRASPTKVLREVNRRAVRRGLELMSTAVCLGYNSLNGQLAYCNAGHPPIRLCRHGEETWEPLEIHAVDSGRLFNLPLAVDADVRYTPGKLQLNPGDRLLLHTDGLTEALDGAGRQLGTSIWEPGRIPGSGAPVADVMRAINEAVAVHAAGVPERHDDVTVMVLEVQPYQTNGRLTLFVKNNFDRLCRSWRQA